MQRIVGVRFKEAGKIYYFDPGDLELDEGNYVVVETPRGPEVAWVVIAPDQLIYNEVTDPKPILRVATPEDLARWEELKARARGLSDRAKRLAHDRNLPLKVAGGDFDLAGRVLALYYTSEERSEFRDFGRDVSRELGVQVQLRQVGPRDQAKMVDGYGICGRRLCCSSWLTNFPSISIKMAKEQDLPLNPSKISGECGRLLCCLSYENEQYKEMRAALPARGQMIRTPVGVAKVVSMNILRQSVMVLTESMTTAEYPVGEVTFERRDGVTAAQPSVVVVEAPAEGPEVEAVEAPQARDLREGEKLLAVPAEAPAGGQPRPPFRRRRRGGRGRRRRGGGQPGPSPSS
jgi:cell fate regulator YaaT (PSP1 superfamily)